MNWNQIGLVFGLSWLLSAQGCLVGCRTPEQEVMLGVSKIADNLSAGATFDNLSAGAQMSLSNPAYLVKWGTFAEVGLVGVQASGKIEGVGQTDPRLTPQERNAMIQPTPQPYQELIEANRPQLTN